jgi:hypothetical protein|tara:strand:+ start:161 stop:517 length:357 start_codon:yes stop_codon:yes gene_type:complete
MTLTHVFRAQSVFLAIWVVLMWFAPEISHQTSGWETTPNLISLGQFLGTAMLAFTVIFWMMPTWAGDNLNQPAIIMGVYLNILFFATGVFQAATGAANFDPSSAAMLVLAGLFFWKSR